MVVIFGYIREPEPFGRELVFSVHYKEVAEAKRQIRFQEEFERAALRRLLKDHVPLSEEGRKACSTNTDHAISFKSGMDYYVAEIENSIVISASVVKYTGHIYKHVIAEEKLNSEFRGPSV